MTDNNHKIDIKEIEEYMKEASENYEDLSEQKLDSFDRLIAKIIQIERQHKYGSQGLDKKLTEIEKEIDRFINTDDFEN